MLKKRFLLCLGSHQCANPKQGKNLMIDIYYKSNLYSYRKTNKRTYWIGIKQGDELDGIFCGNFIVVKSSAFPVLNQEAINQGHSEELFRMPEKPERKSSSGASKKTHKMSISIFN